MPVVPAELQIAHSSFTFACIIQVPWNPWAMVDTKLVGFNRIRAKKILKVFSKDQDQCAQVL